MTAAAAAARSSAEARAVLFQCVLVGWSRFVSCVRALCAYVVVVVVVASEKKSCRSLCVCAVYTQLCA